MAKRSIAGFELGKNWEEKIWNDFLETIENSEKNKIPKILDGILSQAEKKFIAKRLAAVSLVKTGKSYKEIEKLLWISPSSVSALKKVASGESGYESNRSRADKSKSEKKKNARTVPGETILDYWSRLPMPSKSGYKHKK